MSAFLALVQKELRLLTRDVHGLAVLFLMPMLFILIMSLALRDSIGGRGGVELEFLLHSETQAPLSARLQGALSELPGFRAVAASSREEVAAALADERYRFAVLVPADIAPRLAAWGGEQAQAPVDVLLSPGASGPARKLFEITLTQALHELRVQTLLLPQLSAMGLSAEALIPATTPLSGEYVFRGAGAEAVPSSVQQSVPAWLVFGMFFVVIPLSTALLVERQQGTLVRLQVMNVRPWQLLSAKILPYFLVNQVQMLAMLAVGVYLVPRLGGDALNPPASWAGLWLISAATSLAAIGFALMVASGVRSSIEATTLGGGSNIVLAALGGVMVPKFVMPHFMQEAARVSPMSWGLEGFLDVFLRGGAWTEVLPEAGALALFGLVCLFAGSLLFRRQLRGLA